MKKKLNILVLIVATISLLMLNYFKREILIPRNVMLLFYWVFVLIIALAFLQEVFKFLKSDKSYRNKIFSKANRIINLIVGVSATLFFIVVQLNNSFVVVKWAAGLSFFAIAGVLYLLYFQPKLNTVDSSKLTWMPLYFAFCTIFVLLLCKLNGISLY